MQDPYEDCELPEINSVSASLFALRAYDFFLFEHGRTWPQNLLFEAIFQTLTKSQKAIKIQGSCLIIGAKPSAKAAVACFHRLGCKRFFIVDDNEERAREFAATMQRHCLGCQIVAQPRNLLTQMPGSCGAMVFSLSDDELADYHQELSYFNFMLAGGLVVDLKPRSNRKLLDLATKIGARTLDADDIRHARNLLTIESLIKHRHLLKSA